MIRFLFDEEWRRERGREGEKKGREEEKRKRRATEKGRERS